MNGEQLCGVVASYCVCDEPAGHDGPHRCTSDGCGGQWTGSDATGDFAVVRLPQEDEYPVGSLAAIFRFGAL